MQEYRAGKASLCFAFLRAFMRLCTDLHANETVRVGITMAMYAHVLCCLFTIFAILNNVKCAAVVSENTISQVGISLETKELEKIDILI